MVWFILVQDFSTFYRHTTESKRTYLKFQV